MEQEDKQLYHIVAMYEAVDELDNSTIKAFEGDVESTSAPAALQRFSAEHDLEPIVMATVTLVNEELIEQAEGIVQDQ